MRRFDNHLFRRQNARPASAYLGLLTAGAAIFCGIAGFGATPDAAPASSVRRAVPSCEERFGADFVPIVLRAPGEPRRVVCAALSAFDPPSLEGEP